MIKITVIRFGMRLIRGGGERRTRKKTQPSFQIIIDVTYRR